LAEAWLFPWRGNWLPSQVGSLPRQGFQM